LIGRDERINAKVPMTGMRQNSVTRPPLPPLPKGGKREAAPRRGSVLIVVIGLLLLLMLIGFAFFTFANQEQSSAEYYADASKGYSLTVPFDWALEQLIIGPHDTNTQSVLWPGKHSLVPNMLGMFAANPNDNAALNLSYTTIPSDRHPYNGGSGISIISGPLGQAYTDQNFNGLDDVTSDGISNAYLLALNLSPAAQMSVMGTSQAGNGAGSSILARTQIFNNFPRFDVGYTYPDINNAFLAYLGTEASTGNQIVIPSFHRPAILRDNKGQPLPNWQIDNSGNAITDTTTKVLRPHPGHLNVADGKTRRYILVTDTPVYNAQGTQIQAFPFQPSNSYPGQQGLWSIPVSANYDYDADNDLVGPKEGIWLDLGYPMQTLPDGRKTIPLFSMTAVEVDSLVNLNAHGNMAWLTQPTTAGATSNGMYRPFYGAVPGTAVASSLPLPISHSNMGMSSPSEVNPFWALVADPRNSVATYLTPANNSGAASGALAQYRGYFGLSNMTANTAGTGGGGYDMSWIEMANMDLVSLLWGTPNYSVTTPGGSGTAEVFTLDNVVAGRWGDVDNLLTALQTGNPNANVPPTAFNINTYLSNFPLPGVPYYDDDGDYFAGLTDAGYLYSNSFLGMTNKQLGGDWTNYLLPGYGPVAGHVLQPFTTSLYAQSVLYNTLQLFPSMISTNVNAPFQSPVTVLPFGQPLDFTGAGMFVASSGSVGLPANITQPTATTAYLYYNGYQGPIYSGGVIASPIIPYQMSFAGNTAIPPYLYTGATSSPYNGSLSANTGLVSSSSNTYSGGVMDEPDEMVTLSAFSQTSDQAFTLDDLASLQLSQNDTFSSRVQQLASFNFYQNSLAASIRQRFTTASSDRKNHAFGAAPAANTTINTTGNRSWEYGIQSGSGTNIVPNWDGASNSSPQFPPQVIQSTSTPGVGNSMDGLVPANFDTPNTNNTLTGTTGSGKAISGTTAAEPFRMELAALIGAKINNSPTFTQSLAFKTAPYEFRTPALAATPWHQQQKLNINRFLTVADPSYAFGYSAFSQQNQQNPLRYRELTPHPTAVQWTNWVTNSGGNASAAISASSTGSYLLDLPNFSSNPPLQEYWARRDRQQMARDLYVMLYMFGGGQDAVNYATTSNKPFTTTGGPVYQYWQLAQMAQFAVNIVDALDRDDTITMFEYDMDLSDGWNLDDNPISNDIANTSTDRGVVYGVEAQQLAFNEALVIASMRVPQYMVPGKFINHPATYLDDQFNDRTFTYLELYNVSPNPVPVNAQNWQIMLLNLTDAAGANPTPASDAYSVLTFNDYNYTTNYPNGIPAGSPYTIGSRTYSTLATTPADTDGSGNPLPSQFIVDTTFTSGTTDSNLAVGSNVTPYWKVPAQGTTLSLDLVGSAVKSGGASPNENNQPFVLTMGGTTTASTTIGAFCDLAQGAPTINTSQSPFLTTFVLRRRLNLARPAPHILTDGSYATDDADNPYIEVDRISYKNTIVAGQTIGSAGGGGVPFNPRDPSDLACMGNSGLNDLTPKLALLASRERKQPLDGCEGSPGKLGSATLFPAGAPLTFTSGSTTQDRTAYNASGSTSANTIGTMNYYTTNSGLTAFTLWQPHFDRDFASVMELMSVPLYGPSNLPQYMAPPDQKALNTLTSEVPLPSAGSVGPYPYMPLVAQAKFLRPQDPSNIGATGGSGNLQLDNRWYRVLELLDVPSRANMQVENSLLAQYPWLFPQALQRSPGKINLNGLRYGENLFCLLDDPFQFVLNTSNSGYSPTIGSYNDSFENTGVTQRNWWQQFIKARDQLDYTTGLYLPGAPGSRPFRPMSFFDQNLETNSTSSPSSGAPLGNSVDDTLLRTLPLDQWPTTAMNTNTPVSSLDKRGLFEARARADLLSQSGSNTIDYYTRQRLLSKIAGNTTQRSNVFMVWMTISYFEAYVPPGAANGVAQIGAQMQDQVTRRGFFVIDRSLLEDAWVPDLTNASGKNGYFDYSKFIQYRKTLQ
jgi:hypothetical protein